ncbi:MAG: RepB family DNA primase [Anaerolineae bacterium]|nr:RepB family DNA primase [Anaerolineae bacterium]
MTAIHPDGQHRTPSRHIPLNQPGQLHDALQRLLAANQLGWGAFVAVGLRRRGLTRYRRGGERDLLALPAVFVDLDDPTSDALARLRDVCPTPSCITFTGGGFHAYWWLDEPLADMGLARNILRGLQRVSNSDPLSPVQSLRLVGSRNTKAGRDNAPCQLVDMQDCYYPLEAFAPLLPRPTVKLASAPPRRRSNQRSSSSTINLDVLRVVSDQLTRLGYVQQGDWLSGPCLHPAQHQHGDVHHSFGFNLRSGYGNCFRCGSILLKDICHTLGIQPADYGGLFV